MKKTFYWFGGLTGAAVLAFGINEMRDALPTVIKIYTENGREITLLDHDGDLSTVEERITKGRFYAYGSDPPEDGYTEKREFEPPVEIDGKRVNTEVSFYNCDGKKMGTVSVLEPRESGLEKTQITAADSQDKLYAGIARTLRDHAVKNGIVGWSDFDFNGNTLPSQNIEASMEASYKEVVMLRGSEKVILEVPANGTEPDNTLFITFIKESPFSEVLDVLLKKDSPAETQNKEKDAQGEPEREIMLIDVRDLQQTGVKPNGEKYVKSSEEMEIFRDVDMDGKIEIFELVGEANSDLEKKNENYRHLLLEIKYWLGL